MKKINKREEKNRKLGTSLSKEIQYLYTENYKTLLKESKEYLGLQAWLK
jgi:hypothetical protein